MADYLDDAIDMFDSVESLKGKRMHVAYRACRRRGYWREVAFRLMGEIETEARREGITDHAVVLNRIDDSYPFGERKNHPYKMWLKERRAWMLARGLTKSHKGIKNTFIRAAKKGDVGAMRQWAVEHGKPWPKLLSIALKQAKNHEVKSWLIPQMEERHDQNT